VYNYIRLSRSDDVDPLDSHGVQEVTEADYCLHIDASMDQPPFPITIPYPRKELVYIDITDDDNINQPAGSSALEYLDIPDDDDKYIVIEDD
jgi:hypothetical protein